MDINFKDNPMGMNRYMYVNGNPLTYTDPTGHWKLSHITKGKWAKAMGGGVAWAGKSMGNTASRMSKGWDNAARTFNNFTGNSKYGNGQNDWERGDYKKYIFGDPAFGLGLAWTALNYAWAYGTPMGWAYMAKYGPVYSKIKNGAVITYNSPFQIGGAMTLGPFINLSHRDSSDATIRHEMGHVKQWREWGGWKYMGHTWSSPFTDKNTVIWAERNADLRSGTNAYGNRDLMALTLHFAAEGKIDLVVIFSLMVEEFIKGIPTR